MAILKILRYPDSRLYTIAKPVDRVTSDIQTLVRNLTETMYAASGVGLAATQVDTHVRVIVVDTSVTRDQLKVMINPQLVDATGSSVCEEGCLSLPGIYERVKRHEWIRVHALGEDSRPFTLEADGVLSVCVQHEMDHLDGKVFVEYLSQLKRNRIVQKLRKLERIAS